MTSNPNPLFDRHEEHYRLYCILKAELSSATISISCKTGYPYSSSNKINFIYLTSSTSRKALEHDKFVKIALLWLESTGRSIECFTWNLQYIMLYFGLKVLKIRYNAIKLLSWFLIASFLVCKAVQSADDWRASLYRRLPLIKTDKANLTISLIE